MGEDLELTVFVVVTHLGFLVGGRVTGRLDGLFGDVDVLLVGGTGRWSVKGVVVGVRVARSFYVGVVLGSVTLAVLTLGDVDGAGVGLAVSVDLDVSVGVLGVRRPGREGVSKLTMISLGLCCFSSNGASAADPWDGAP